MSIFRLDQALCSSFAYSSGCLISFIRPWSWTRSSFDTPSCLKCCTSYFLGGQSIYKLSSNLSLSSDSPPLQYQQLLFNAMNIARIFQLRNDDRLMRFKMPNRIESRYEHVPLPRVVFISNVEEAKKVLNFSSATAQKYTLISSYQTSSDAELLNLASSVVTNRNGFRDKILDWHWMISGKDSLKRTLLSPFLKQRSLLNAGIRTNFPIPNALTTTAENALNRSVTLTCFSRADIQKNRLLRERCVSFLGVAQCDKCVHISSSEPPPTNAYATALLSSRFVVVLPDGKAGLMHPDHCDAIADTVLSSWVAEAILSGTIPILDSTCKQVLKGHEEEGGVLHQLPVLWSVIATDHLTEEFLRTSQANMIAKRNEYSISSLFLPYWIHRVAQFPMLDAHITRGRSRVAFFAANALPKLTAVAHSKPFQPEKKLSGQEKICSSPLTTSRREGEDAGNRGVDIVLPRCCESVSGDLLWVRDLAQKWRGSQMNGLQLRFFVYYKCPWCIPASLLANFTASPSPTRDRLIKQHGGVHVLDELTLPSGPGPTATGTVTRADVVLVEHSAFDLDGPNAKEATVRDVCVIDWSAIMFYVFDFYACRRI